jgi:hypothetical protein
MQLWHQQQLHRSLLQHLQQRLAVAPLLQHLQHQACKQQQLLLLLIQVL